MTSIQSHHYSSQMHSSTNGPNLDNNLDALLDDLQTSVTRPNASSALATGQEGPLLNGSSFSGHQVNLPPGATGYREITTTVTQETNGVPMTSREYQIEYLNPANTVTVLDERSSTPGLELLKTDIPGQQVSSYKTETYGYKYSEKSSESKSSVNKSQPEFRSIDYPQDKSYQFSRTENYRSEGGNLNKNLNELDVLLKELNNTNSSNYSPRSPTSGRRAEHVSRSVETRVERSPGRSYVDSSGANRSSSLNREEVFSERGQLRPSRAQSPGVNPGGSPKIPRRTVDVKQEISSIEQRSHVSRRDSPSNRDRTGELSPILKRRTPSPTSGEFRPAHFSTYPLSPKETQTSRTVVSKTYNYSGSSAAGRRTPTPTSFDDSQPYRSPSPVSFPQKRSPSPARKNLARSDSGRTLTYQVSPQLSDPNSPTVITYKYTSHSSQHNKYPGGAYESREPVTPKPFPTNTQIPIGEQNPPKKLDELMASFHDGRRTYATEYRSSARETERAETVDLQRSPSFERNLRPSNVKATQIYSQHQVQQLQAPVNEIVPPPTPPPQKPKTPPATKSVAGPPVYYPPGVELFTKKEEIMEQQSAGGKGKMKGKAKMKYKYEKSEKSKEKSSKGMAAVPVCLPVCCAMPCVIM